MRNEALIVLAAVAALALTAVRDASAHGGPRRRTPERESWFERDPKDPTPPPESPATPTPTPGLPPGPPGDPVDMSPPPPVRPPVTSRSPVPLSFESWLFWWQANREDLVAVRNRRPPANRRITHALVETTIRPALRRMVEDPSAPPEIRGAALVALARASSSPLLPEQFTAHCPLDGAGDPLVRQSAVRAIGLAPAPGVKARDHLLAIASNPDLRRTDRSYAILSLGLLRDDRDEVWRGLNCWLDGRSVSIETPVCVFLSLGVIGDPKQTPALLEILEARRYEKEKLGDLEIAWLIEALGRIGSPTAAEPVARQLRRKGIYARRAAVIALGRLVPRTGPADQLAHIQWLGKVLTRDPDRTTRNFLTISLGRIAADPAATGEARRRAGERLLGRYREGLSGMEQPFAALGLALGRVPGAGELLRAELALPSTLPRWRGAYAVALGLLGDPESAGLLRALLVDPSLDHRLRARAALALGLIHDTAAAPAVLAALREVRDAESLVDTAIAAHLLGIDEAVPYLTGILANRKSSQYLVLAALRALAVVGDRRAVGPLLAVEAEPTATRAAAIDALGRLAEARRRPARTRLSRDLNYRALVPDLERYLQTE